MILTSHPIAYSQTISANSTPKHSTQDSSPEQDYARGLNYINGETFDADEAFKWIASAAEHNHSEAMHLLGMMYFNGIGTDFNLNQAIYWMEKAVVTNSQPSKQQLAVFQELKKYVHSEDINQWPPHVRMVIGDIIHRALAGDAAAQTELSSMYASGGIIISTEPFTKNKERSHHWFQQAVAQNYAPALLWMAENSYRLYLKNRSIDDLNAAIKWTKLSLKGKHSSQPLELVMLERAEMILEEFEQELKQANTKPVVPNN